MIRALDLILFAATAASAVLIFALVFALVAT
jgi:hypothetical protein